MATNARNIVLNSPVNPAIMPGLRLYTGKVTNVDNTKTVTLTVIAKTILFDFAYAGATVLNPVITSDGNSHTIVITSGADNSEINYLIIASVVEDIDHPAAADTTSIELTSKT